MPHANAPNIRHCIDDIAVRDGAMQISGWAYVPGEALSPRGVFIRTPRPLEGRPLILLHEASPDLEALFGASAAACRFAISLPVVSKSNIDAMLASEVVIVFRDGLELPLAPFPHRIVNLIRRTPLASMKIGLGVTTYNRSATLGDTLALIGAKSVFVDEIFVADDGSTDDTVETLRHAEGVSWVTGRNRGIAWNKNRALFHLAGRAGCDIILLIEDDVQPETFGWDVEWVLATLMFGHVNFAPHWFVGVEPGRGSWSDPIRSGKLTGQCSGFTREAVDYVGFLDSRFGRYGHEHVEHTARMIRAGYGGEVIRPGTPECTFFLISGSLRLVDVPSSGTPEAVQNNGRIYGAIWNESIFRAPWSSDAELVAFRDEMAAVSGPSPGESADVLH